jgi:signal peptidase I
VRCKGKAATVGGFMLGFAGPARKARKEGHQWWQMGRKVYHYRKDRMSPDDVALLEVKLKELRATLKGPDKRDPNKIRDRIGELEPILKRNGGAIYPRRWLADNADTLLVAAIVVLALRAFFFQPFKIPTNSMYPTYHGMTWEVYEPGEELPAPPLQALRFLALGASQREVVAPQDGRIYLPLNDGRAGRDLFSARPVNGRKFLVWPTVVNEYPIFVDGVQTTIRVPADFPLSRVIRERYFPESADLSFREWMQSESFQRNRVQVGGQPALRLPERAEAGEPILAFEILTGDALFVDRISYHFTRPDVGDPFVFRDDGIQRMNGQPLDAIEKYYIKRLVGVPGDTLEVRDGVLYRNGKPIEGAPAFALNANREGQYQGYTNEGILASGRSVTIPENTFFAMGDNSDESSDSRGTNTANGFFVPEQAVVGKALFIYHPFTHRWGVTD